MKRFSVIFYIDFLRNKPDVDAHEVLEGFNGDGSGRNEEPEAFVEPECRFDLLKDDLIGDHVAEVGRVGVAVDQVSVVLQTCLFRPSSYGLFQPLIGTA